MRNWILEAEGERESSVLAKAFVVVERRLLAAGKRNLRLFERERVDRRDRVADRYRAYRRHYRQALVRDWLIALLIIGAVLCLARYGDKWWRSIGGAESDWGSQQEDP